MIQVNIKIDAEREHKLWVTGEISEDGNILAQFEYLQDPEAMHYLRKTVEFLTK